MTFLDVLLKNMSQVSLTDIDKLWSVLRTSFILSSGYNFLHNRINSFENSSNAFFYIYNQPNAKTTSPG